MRLVRRATDSEGEDMITTNEGYNHATPVRTFLRPRPAPPKRGEFFKKRGGIMFLEELCSDNDFVIILYVEKIIPYICCEPFGKGVYYVEQIIIMQCM